MMARFNLPGPPPAPRDAEIIKRASGLRIDLWKDKDGDIHGGIEISCGFGVFGEGEQEDYDGSKQRDALRFVKELLCAFEQKQKDNPGDSSASLG